MVKRTLILLLSNRVIYYKAIYLSIGLYIKQVLSIYLVHVYYVYQKETIYTI